MLGGSQLALHSETAITVTRQQLLKCTLLPRITMFHYWLLTGAAIKTEIKSLKWKKWLKNFQELWNLD